MKKPSIKVFVVGLALTVVLAALPFGFAPMTAFADGMSLQITRSTETPTASVGGVVSYTITVTNHGSDDAASTILPEALDVRLKYLGSAASQGHYDLDTGWWAIGSIAGGQTQTLVVTAEIVEAGESIQGLFTVPDGSVATPTDVTLTSIPNPSFIGNVSLQAAMSPSTATGHVIFYIDGAPVHTEPLVDGVASWVYAFEAIGEYAMTAEYGGDADYRSSRSAGYTHIVVAPVSIRDIPGVKPPVAGATPVTAIAETAQYTGTVAWSGDPAIFAGNTTYTATVTLTPKEGYTLSGIMADFFRIADAVAVSNEAHSGVVTARFEQTDDTGTLRAIKTVSGAGATIAEGQFRFGVFDESGNLVSVGANAHDGSVVFDPIAYSEPGEYTYTVRELSPSVGGWTTDDSEHSIAVTIMDDGRGQHIVMIGYPNETLEFVNVYEPHALAVSAGAGGLVNLSDTTQRSAGELISAVATPNNGYRFTGWTVTGATLADAAANPAVFDMPASDVTLTANFESVYQLPQAPGAPDTVRLILHGDGGVFDDGSETAILTYPTGDELGTPDEPTRDGFVFAGWYTGRAEGEQAEVDFVILEDTELVAGWAQVGVVATGGPDAYLRMGPGTQHRIIAQYPNETEVLYLGEADGWFHVQIIDDGEQGYMHRSLVKLTDIG